LNNAIKGRKFNANVFGMLSALRIKNLALVEDLSIEFQPGCNAITGETGAGKSILIGALSLVLGERASKSLIRSGADKCTVEAVFDVRRLPAPLDDFLEDNGLEPCDEHQLLLKRSFSASGVNRQFVNGSPTTLGTLAAIGDWLVDMHGPHDHQSLLHPARQLALLDAFAGIEKQVNEFAALLRKRSTLEEEKARLIVDEQTYAQQLDLLRFQVKEIQGARLDPDEEEALEAEYQRASNATRLIEAARNALALIDDDSDSLFTRIAQIGQQLHELQRLDESADDLVEMHEQIATLVHELQSELSSYADKVDLDPARLRELEDRLNLIQSFKRKYGPDVPAIIAFGEEAARKLHALESRDAELERINTELAGLDAQLKNAGAALTDARHKAGARLARAVVKQLRDLGFKQSHFDLSLEPLGSPSAAGFDRVEFQFAPNIGEPPQSLRAIASSGEMARVMLAIKTVLAAQDRIPVLVFDEIDANIGGETARVVGEKMRQLARQRQVLCITHLPQVAAAASHHLRVTKRVSRGRTTTTIEALPDSERVNEIARMLGGKSDIARQHAAELLQA